jgi:hypothetical protein
VRVGADGRFGLRLPASLPVAHLRVNTVAGTTEGIAVAIDSDRVDAGPITSGAPARIALPRLGPARLIFQGIDGTPDPDFHDNLLGYRLDGETHRDIQAANYLSLTGHADEARGVALPPGDYRVLATRGLEYGVSEARLSVAAGENRVLDIAPPPRELHDEGWLSADFHVHAAPSFDSSLPIAERLRSFIAQGGEVLVASEHNRVVDYQQTIDRLGFNDDIRVLTGSELTGLTRLPPMILTNGHSNIFPIEARPEQFAGGLIPREGKRLRTLIDDVRTAYPGALFQLNHPRADEIPDRDFVYFDHLLSGEGFDPALPLTAERNRSLIEPDPATGLRDIDFDLMEIANGADEAGSYEAIRRDWFALLRHGERIVGTANSDSHGSGEIIAVPRNYVQLAGDYSQQAFLDAVRSGKLFGTTGPLLKVSAQAADGRRFAPGDTMPAGKVTLAVRVEAASWVPVNRLTIYVNGEVYSEAAVKRGEVLEVAMDVKPSSFIVVEATGEADALYHAVAPGFTPFAFTNPIYTGDATEER